MNDSFPKRVLTAAALIALSVPWPAARAETGQSALLQATATVQAGNQFDFSFDGNQWSSPYAALRSSVYAYAQDGPDDPHGVTTASVSGYATADWTSQAAGQGVVEFHDGWAIVPRDRSASGTLDELTPSFLYSFTAAAGGEWLNVAYAHTGSTQIGWNVVLEGGPDGSVLTHTAGLTGVYSAYLVGGESYNFILRPIAGSLSGTASVDALFAWSIGAAAVAVPEPSAAALLAAGLAAVAWRRRSGR